MSEYTFETAALKAVTIDAVKYNEEGLRNSITPETIQAVAPIAWGEYTEKPTTNNYRFTISIGSGAGTKYEDSIAIGKKAYAATKSVAVGANAYGFSYGVGIGNKARAELNKSISIGHESNAGKDTAITIGAAFEDTAGSYTCTTEGTGSITIGPGANTKNNGEVESSNSVTIGCKANTTAPDSITLGAGASNTNSGSILIGSAAKSEGDKALTITLGSQFTETTDAGDITYPCSTEGTGSITIGAGANTLNPTNADGTPVLDSEGKPKESTNSITIGYKASNSSANSVVIGAQASGTKSGSVVIGVSAEGKTEYSTVIGCEAKAQYMGLSGGYKTSTGTCGVSLGANSETSTGAIAIGGGAKATKEAGIAIGYKAKSANEGAVVLVSRNTYYETDDLIKTQLYFSGAGTPLANEYEDGEAMMGYVVTDKAGNIMMDAQGNALVGTQKLSVLFPNNRGENAFTPAALNLDENWTPKPMFHPSDLDLPNEEPEVEEPENIEPPKPLVYKPQPVYPIVEPEIEEINE